MRTRIIYSFYACGSVAGSRYIHRDSLLNVCQHAWISDTLGKDRHLVICRASLHLESGPFRHSVSI